MDRSKALDITKCLILGLLACLVAVPLAHAEKRVALVIGNSSYVKVRALPNPEKDAAAMAALFRASGFDVVEAQNNMNGSAMRRAFRNFSDTARDADIAVVYYAGHGIEVDGTNYILPVDTVLERDLDVEDEAVSLDRIIKVLEPAKRLRLVILDACRDNPFVKTMKHVVATRSIGRGLARVEPPSSDTLIAFAAKAGSTAADGDGPHSPFTDALLRHLTTPGLDLRLAFGQVRDEVLRTTNNRQEPFVYGSLGGTTVSLVPATTPAVATAPPAPVTAPAPQSDPSAIARGDYEFALQVGTLQAWDSFLVAHPVGFYADLARAQRERINSTARTAAMSPAATPEMRKPAVDPAETAHLVHKELTRLGCYSGDVDGPWGKSSRDAMTAFNRHSGMKLEVSAASTDTLDALRDKTARICPLECARGFVPGDNDQCVRKPAESASAPDKRQERDKREGKRHEQDKRQEGGKRQAGAPSAAGAAGAAAGRGQAEHSTSGKIMCGMTGCVTIKKGCRGEIRPSGHDVVAVEICG
jgi:hypothetical protein